MTTTDLKELALAAKAAEARYALGEPERGDQDAIVDFGLSFTPDAILDLIRERDEAIKSSDAVCDSYAEENQRLFDRAETAEAALSSYKEEVERLRDKVDGLTAELENAVAVAFKHGATDWTRLNYQTQYEALTKEPPHAE